MNSLHVLFSDEGHPVAIRKWSQEPFEGGEEYVRKSDFANLIAACDAALDWADANVRAFPIETAPDEGIFYVWDSDEEKWKSVTCYGGTMRWPKWVTHWTQLKPPPSNPPLPAPLEALGAVLRRVKGGE